MARHLTVRYKVKHDKVAEVKHALREFVEVIEREEPEIVRYESFQLGDVVTFVHFMSFPNEAVEERHRDAEHTRKFVEALYPNCEEEPVFTDLMLVCSNQGVS